MGSPSHAEHRLTPAEFYLNCFSPHSLFRIFSLLSMPSALGSSVTGCPSLSSQRPARKSLERSRLRVLISFSGISDPCEVNSLRVPFTPVEAAA